MTKLQRELLISNQLDVIKADIKENNPYKELRDNNVRTLYLVNDELEFINMTAQPNDLTGNCFLANVQGLGYNVNYEYQQIENNSRIISKEKVFNVVTGDVYFGGYDGYKNFVKFMMRSKNVKLFYFTPYKNEDEYEDFSGIAFADCVIEKLDKGEIDLDGFLVCPVQIKTTSTWKNSNLLSQFCYFGTSDNMVNAKFYNDDSYTFDDINKDSPVYSSTDNTKIEINTSTNGRIYPVFTLTGEFINPTIKITDAYDNEICSMRLLINTTADDVVKIHTEVFDYYVINNEQNIYQNIDMTQDTTLFLQNGFNEINLLASDGDSGTLRIDFREEYDVI